jgi:glycine cleavage system H protein
MNLDKKYNIPADRYYDPKNHMWILYNEKKNIAIIGIDEFGLDSFGELAYVSFNKTLISINKNEAIGSLEAAKMVGNIFTPVSGRIIEVNNEVIKNPSLINDDPYDKGWLIKVECADWQNEKESSIYGEQIPSWVSSEMEKLES